MSWVIFFGIYWTNEHKRVAAFRFVSLRDFFLFIYSSDNFELAGV